MKMGLGFILSVPTRGSDRFFRRDIRGMTSVTSICGVSDKKKCRFLMFVNLVSNVLGTFLPIRYGYVNDPRCLPKLQVPKLSGRTTHVCLALSRMDKWIHFHTISLV